MNHNFMVEHTRWGRELLQMKQMLVRADDDDDVDEGVCIKRVRLMSECVEKLVKLTRQVPQEADCW